MIEGEAVSAARADGLERGMDGSCGDDPIARAVERFQAGEGREAAFRSLYETYFQPIYRFFLRKGLAPEDSLDLTQETFLGVYKGLATYEHRLRFAAWLYRVATTTYLKWLRHGSAAKRSAVEVSRDAMEHQDPGLTVPGRQLEGAIHGERRAALRAAVGELPEQMRDCLTLRVYHQLAYHEIATVKKLSVETVKAHLFRARKRLAERLGSDPLRDQEG